MIIAISAQGDSVDSDVDPRFGRAAWFLIHDTDTGKTEPMDNGQNLELAQGAGIQVAQQVADAGARVVLTGNCGPKAFTTLQASGVEVVVGCSGTVAQALERYAQGDMKPAQGPNKRGHWSRYCARSPNARIAPWSG